MAVQKKRSFNLNDVTIYGPVDDTLWIIFLFLYIDPNAWEVEV